MMREAKTNHRVGGVWARGARTMFAAGSLAILLGIAGVTRVVHADDKAPTQATESTPDTLIFRNGNVMTGTIVSETATNVRFKSMVAGIAFETDYEKSQILDIKRPAKAGVKTTAKPGKASETPAAAVSALESGANAAMKPLEASAALGKAAAAGGTSSDADGATTTRYYWINLTGDFGTEISETPLRKAIREAKANKADVIVVKLDATWTLPSDKDTKREDFQVNFDEVFRAEKMTPIFVDEMPTEWEKMPKVVFYVKNAMGGSALLPLVCKNIYFQTDARLGGIGNLSDMMKGGHERVVAKQVSLRLQHVVGWANVGGYPEELIRAMAMRPYVLSVKIVDGKPVYFERVPESADEVLLTDDGEDERKDTISQVARNEGNDALIFDASKAQLCRLSQGTVESDEELLAVLGLDRGGINVGKGSDAIMKDWATRLEQTKKSILRLMDEYREVQVRPPAGYPERTAARGQRKQKLEQIKGLLKQWEEALSGNWLRQYEVPGLAEIDSTIETIKREQLLDKK